MRATLRTFITVLWLVFSVAGSEGASTPLLLLLLLLLLLPQQQRCG